MLLCVTILGVATLNALRLQPKPGTFVLLQDINMILEAETSTYSSLSTKIEASYNEKFKKVYSSDRELATNRNKLCKDTRANVRKNNGKLLEEFMKKEGLSYTENALGMLCIELPRHYMTKEQFYNRLKELQVHQALAYLEEQLIREQDKKPAQHLKPGNPQQDVGGGYVIQVEPEYRPGVSAWLYSWIPFSKPKPKPAVSQSQDVGGNYEIVPVQPPAKPALNTVSPKPSSPAAHEGKGEQPQQLIPAGSGYSIVVSDEARHDDMDALLQDDEEDEEQPGSRPNKPAAASSQLPKAGENEIWV